MQSASYYREQSARAKRLARSIHDLTMGDDLERMARDFDEIAEDLENGAVEVEHPSRMPQQQSQDKAG